MPADAPPPTDEERARLLSQRRFRVTEAVVAALSLLVILAMLLALPARADQYTDEVTLVVYGIMLTIGLQWALMLRLGWRVYNRPASRVLRRRYPFRGWWFTPFTPVLATVLLLPWALRGTFGLASSVGGDLALLLLVFVMAALIGVLAVPAVLVPLELLVRGLVLVVSGKSTSDRRAGRDHLGGALYLGGLTVFVVAVGGGVSFEGVGRAAWGPVVLALIGIPLGYDVENPVLLWIGRVMLYAFLGHLAVDAVLRRRAKRARTAQERPHAPDPQRSATHTAPPE